jgi:hypothetical protein
VGNNGQLQVFWANGPSTWGGPLGISATNFAPPGAPIAASQHFGIAGQTDVFVVDNNGQLCSFWVKDSGEWHGPVRISDTAFAPAAAHLAAGQQFGAENQTNAYVVGNNGQLSVFWVENNGDWNGPVPISAANFASDGAPISVSQQFGAENQTNVALADNTGRLNIFFVENANPWAGPVQISPAVFAPPGAATALEQRCQYGSPSI